LLRFNLGSEPELRDPGVMSGQPDGRFARLVFEGLTTADPRTLEPRPGQAYRWQVSADGLVYTFHLRPKLAWRMHAAHRARLPLLVAARAGSRPRPRATRASSTRFAGAEDFNKGVSPDDSKLGLAAPDDSTFRGDAREPHRVLLFLHQLLHVRARAAASRGGVGAALDAAPAPGGERRVPLELLAAERPLRVRALAELLGPRERQLDKIVGYTVDDLNTSTNLYESGGHRLEPE